MVNLILRLRSSSGLTPVPDITVRQGFILWTLVLMVLVGQRAIDMLPLPHWSHHLN